MPSVLSRFSPTAEGSGCQKLGQPVPLSNFVFEENSSRRQPRSKQKRPARCSSFKGLLKGRSVPSWRRIW